MSVKLPPPFLYAPHGVRPDHLKIMLNYRESGPDLLTALTAFANLVLVGHCPKSALLFALDVDLPRWTRYLERSLYAGWFPSVPMPYTVMLIWLLSRSVLVNCG